MHQIPVHLGLCRAPWCYDLSPGLLQHCPHDPAEVHVTLLRSLLVQEPGCCVWLREWPLNSDSSYDGDLRLPLGLALGSPIFPSGCEGKLGVALESLQGLRDLT